MPAHAGGRGRGSVTSSYRDHNPGVSGFDIASGFEEKQEVNRPSIT
jgi:hypothetical protein